MRCPRKGVNFNVTKLRWLDRFLGGKDLEHINRALIDRVTDAKLAQGCSNATVNRTLELVRAILRRCVNEWEWLERAPYVRMLNEPKRRIRFLTRDEAQRLLVVLPEHLGDMAAFSLATGLRAANVTGLQWSQVDLVRRLAWIHPDQAKARKAIAVPLNAEAVALIRTQLGRHQTHVFSFRGKPIRQLSTKAWYAALERAGIADFRWHDLRHTWASWHVQSGTPLFALQEMGGWESPEMVRRLAWIHPDQAKARKAIAVPLNAEAVVIIRRQTGKHPTHVFSYEGKPIRQVGTKAWYAALQRAGIEDFRWHDLRHTWASWHVQQGTPLHALQELGGWESSEMVRRYAHFSADHLAPYADRLCALRVVDDSCHGTNSAHPAKEKGAGAANPLI